jgi:hypothetical protein
VNKKLLALYGLKWNPFSPELPTEALRATAAIENFVWRIEQGLVREGGFALVTGDVGTGKSVTLRLLAERLGSLPEVNTPPAKAGGFGLRLKAGSVGLRPTTPRESHRPAPAAAGS